MNKPDKSKAFMMFENFLKIMKKFSRYKTNVPGSIGDNYFSLRDEILNAFSLPDIPEYSEILEKMESKSDFEKTYNELIYKGGEYTTLDLNSRLQILKEGIINHENAFELLPKINISTHVYTLFVYNIALEEQELSCSAILEELDLAAQHLNDLGMLECEYSEELYRKLKSVDGLTYLDHFVEANIIDFDL